MRELHILSLNRLRTYENQLEKMPHWTDQQYAYLFEITYAEVINLLTQTLHIHVKFKMHQCMSYFQSHGWIQQQQKITRTFSKKMTSNGCRVREVIAPQLICTNSKMCWLFHRWFICVWCHCWCNKPCVCMWFFVICGKRVKLTKRAILLSSFPISSETCYFNHSKLDQINGFTIICCSYFRLLKNFQTNRTDKMLNSMRWIQQRWNCVKFMESQSFGKKCLRQFHNEREDAEPI